MTDPSPVVGMPVGRKGLDRIAQSTQRRAYPTCVWCVAVCVRSVRRTHTIPVEISMLICIKNMCDNSILLGEIVLNASESKRVRTPKLP